MSAREGGVQLHKDFAYAPTHLVFPLPFYILPLKYHLILVLVLILVLHGASLLSSLVSLAILPGKGRGHSGNLKNLPGIPARSS